MRVRGYIACIMAGSFLVGAASTALIALYVSVQL